MPKEKTPYQKIRKTWVINPRERIKEDKKSFNPCEKCGRYKTDPEGCIKCKYYEEPIQEIGNA